MPSLFIRNRATCPFYKSFHSFFSQKTINIADCRSVLAMACEYFYIFVVRIWQIRLRKTQSDMATGWTKTYTTDGKLVDPKDTTKGISGKATQDDWQSTDPGLGWTSYAGKAESGAVIKVTYTHGTAGKDGSVTVNFSK